MNIFRGSLQSTVYLLWLIMAFNLSSAYLETEWERNRDKYKKQNVSLTCFKDIKSRVLHSSEIRSHISGELDSSMLTFLQTVENLF